MGLPDNVALRRHLGSTHAWMGDTIEFGEGGSRTASVWWQGTSDGRIVGNRAVDYCVATSKSDETATLFRADGSGFS